MIGAVRPRANHYDVLGLTPAARDDDIARAFARKMNAFRWHPAGASAELWIAYETLRDRIKRADYDRSLGLAPNRQSKWTMEVTRQQWTPFIASDEPRQAPAAAPEPQVREEPQWEPKTDPLEPVIQDILTLGRTEKEKLRYLEAKPFDWKRPAQALGGLILGAGIFGVVLGLSARDNQPVQAQSAGVGRPAAKAAATVMPEALAAPLATQPDQAEPSDHFWTTVRRTPPRHRPAPAAAQHADQVPAAQNDPMASPTDAASGDQAVADPLAPSPVEARLPLPKSVIARTIDRIGYSCGEVASATAGGAPGTFTVTCSSGQSYQAAPSHGRYHFRRSGR
jgi:hypothetical protein